MCHRNTLFFKKTFVILDNARIHKANIIKDFAIEHEEDLFLLFQPPYFPELNPQENIWNWLKKFLSTPSAYISIEELSKKHKEFSNYINNNPEKIKQRAGARNYYK